MLFTEPTFLFLFLPLLLALYFAPDLIQIVRRAVASPHARYANWLLLVASVIFYAKGGGAFTWLMLGSIAFNYWMAIAVDRSADPAMAKRWLAIAVTVNLVVLGIYKYANFFVENVNALSSAAGLPRLDVPPVLLPIGISFFTFHAISYVIDVARRDATAQKSPVHAALYLLLFPQLIAGPIIRYRDIADQLARRVVSIDDFAYGVRRFIVGLGKKVLIANVVAGPADKIFAMPAAQLSPAHAWLGIVCYTLQIYFDFSGYSDMAIGLGRMFGFRFPENFRWPYIAASVQEFWRRWHISLSTWFRDYLYIPLGGNRVSRARQYRNLITVFFLCGLWHGASWNFVIWGLWHGMFLVIERLVAERNPQSTNPQSASRNPQSIRNPQSGLREPQAALSLPKGAIRNDVGVANWPIWPHLYTLAVVVIGWVFFRAETLTVAVAFLKAMGGAAATAPTPYTLSWYLTPELWLALVAGALGSTPWIAALAPRLARLEPRPLAIGVRVLATASLIAALVASIMSMSARTYNPFIYFRF